MNLSKDFTLEEMTISQEAVRSGLSNKPNAQQIANLKSLCVNVMQPISDKVGRPVIISSGFRSVTINRRIGGADNSQHCRGQACDFIIPGIGISYTIEIIRSLGIHVDQVISEFGAWVHVSYGPRMRNQYLIATLEGGRVFYKPF